MAAPLFNRQKVILDLISRAPRRPAKLQLVKWLFLAGEETGIRDEVPFYDFVPYQYGPFSFTAYRELARLQERGLVDEELRVQEGEREVAEGLVDALGDPVRQVVTDVLAEYGRLRSKDLLDYVYSTYPWFASRSRLRPPGQVTKAPLAVYTAGYEGESIDHFLNRLLQGGIERLIDVRRNPYSRKYGFSGGPLRRTCRKLRIEYRHLPGLGIPSKLRRDIETRRKRDRLFRHYENEMLPLREQDLDAAAKMVGSKPSALMCVEHDVDDCHRGPLSRAVARLSGLKTIHL